MNNKSDEISTEQPTDIAWFNNPRGLFVITIFLFVGVLLNALGPVHTPFNMVLLALMFVLLLINGYRFIDRLIAEIKS